MRTKSFLKHFFLGALMLTTGQLVGQSTTLGNVANANTDFLGWNNNAANNFPLMVRHDLNFPIDWYTSATWRARLMPTGTAAINTFPNIAQDGFFLLSGTADPLTNANNRAPFTRLHLVDPQVSGINQTVYAQELGFRPWQRNGITFTGNRDQAYIGQRYLADDQTDFVVQWSDNAANSPWGTDRLKFVFTSAFNPAAVRGATSAVGLEAMRLFPVNLLQVNVGIGDFSQAGVGDPTERLDMLDGRLRIRQLPDDPEHTGTFEVMVVDNSASPSGERGVVKWVDPSVLTGATDCDWDINTASKTLTTAHAGVGTNTNCPEEDWAVGVGTNQPTYKLDVRHDETVSGDADLVGGINSRYVVRDGQQGIAVLADVLPENGGSLGGIPYGLWGRVFDAGDEGVGASGVVTTKTINGQAFRMHGLLGTVHGPADDGTLTLAYGMSGSVLGVEGGGPVARAYGSWSEVDALAPMGLAVGSRSYVHGAEASDTRIGFDGYVLGEDNTVACYGARITAFGGTQNNYGVHVQAFGANAMAGYFYGDVDIDGDLTVSGTYPSSDAMLKTNVEPIGSPMEIIAQLQPRRYDFLTDQFPQMALPEGNHMGFIAQEIEEVLPGIVKTFHQSPMTNADGEQLAEGFDYKGVNYTEVIPLLVAGMQQQQEQIAVLQEQLAACCTAAPTDSDQRNGSIGTGAVEEKLTPAQERSLRIIPNPMVDRTTLYCNLERAGRMQLLANSSDGRELMVLAEGQREAGEFQQVWSTENLAPGVYYITLLLDGEPVVKRAVKVGR